MSFVGIATSCKVVDPKGDDENIVVTKFSDLSNNVIYVRFFNEEKNRYWAPKVFKVSDNDIKELPQGQVRAVLSSEDGATKEIVFDKETLDKVRLEADNVRANGFS